MFLFAGKDIVKGSQETADNVIMQTQDIFADLIRCVKQFTDLPVHMYMFTLGQFGV